MSRHRPAASPLGSSGAGCEGPVFPDVLACTICSLVSPSALHASQLMQGCHCCLPSSVVLLLRQAVAAAEAYIQQHGLDDVQIEVETRTMDELREVS